MTKTEQRRQIRYPLRRQPAGTLRLFSRGLVLQALAVKDVSVGGVGLYLERALPPGSPVALEYAGQVSVKVQGIVAWCRARGAEDADIPPAVEAHVVGVELLSPAVLLTAFQEALPATALSAED